MPDLIACLDLGQTSDPSALALLRRSMVLKGGIPVRSNKGGILPKFVVVHLQRFPMGTAYPDIVQCTADMLGSAKVRPWKPRLAVDATGVGRAVMDMFMPALRAPHADGAPILALEDLYPITITAGDKWSAHAYAPGVHGFHVPKLELVSCVQAALGSDRLQFGKLASRWELEAAKAELKNFRIKPTKAGNQQFQARDGDHDDIVLAIACGAWLGSLPRMSHRSALAFADIEDAASASGKSIDEVMEEARETADPETLSLIDEHEAEKAAMGNEAEDRRKQEEREHRSPNNPLWWDN